MLRSCGDLILTNSFGGTRYRLKLHQADSRVAELNIAAASILREVAAACERDIIVAGSIGPTGEILAPLGDLQPEDAIAAFAEQALALEQGGADVLWIETMSSQEEVEYAVAGARKTSLPIVFTMSFDTNGRTMMGVGASDMMALHQRLGVHACGTNCGIGASEVVAAILNFQANVADGGDNPILIAKANCGKLRHPGIYRRRNSLQRYARDHGALRDHGARCRRAHRRRLLWHFARTRRRHAPRTR